eukprot:8942407-Alexandrium_andersonii.AAC.1
MVMARSHVEKHPRLRFGRCDHHCHRVGLLFKFTFVRACVQALARAQVCALRAVTKGTQTHSTHSKPHRDRNIDTVTHTRIHTHTRGQISRETEGPIGREADVKRQRHIETRGNNET